MIAGEECTKLSFVVETWCGVASVVMSYVTLCAVSHSCVKLLLCVL